MVYDMYIKIIISNQIKFRVENDLFCDLDLKR